MIRPDLIAHDRVALWIGRTFPDRVRTCPVNVANGSGFAAKSSGHSEAVGELLQRRNFSRPESVDHGPIRFEGEFGGNSPSGIVAERDNLLALRHEFLRLESRECDGPAQRGKEASDLGAAMPAAGGRDFGSGADYGMPVNLFIDKCEDRRDITASKSRVGLFDHCCIVLLIHILLLKVFGMGIPMLRANAVAGCIPRRLLNAAAGFNFRNRGDRKQTL